MDTGTNQSQTNYPSNKKNIAFAVIVLLYEIALCLIYGLVYGYRVNAPVFNDSKD